MDIPKIFADFNNADSLGRIRLTTNGTIADMKRLGIVPEDGKQVILDDSDGISTLGKMKFSEEENIWVAEIDWSTIM